MNAFRQKRKRRQKTMNDDDDIFDSIDLVEAVGPRLLVEVEEEKEMTPGGIALLKTDTRREQDTTTIGILRKKGPTAFEHMGENQHIPEIGDKVLFIKFAGNELKIDGKYYRVLIDEDIYLRRRVK